MREIHPDEMLGLVVVDGQWTAVLGVVAEYILDYPSYYPNYDPSEFPDVVFRGGLDVVTPADGSAFLKALESQAVPIAELADLVEEHGPVRTRPVVLIDFDEAMFISSFFDIALEDEVGPVWTGSYADPMKAAPLELQAIWPPLETD